ncbi:MAG: hypothetical protein PVG63_02765, partial [Anaerolineales bacterium]
MKAMNSDDSQFAIRWYQLGLLLIVMVILAGCSSPVLTKVWLEPPGWTRGVLVASGVINEQAALVVDDEGDAYIATFINSDPPEPHVWRFDPSGTLAWEIAIEDFETNFPSQPRLAWIPEGLALLWVDQGHLFQMVLDDQGVILEQPSVISGDLEVDSYDIERLHDGVTIWVGGGEDQPGIYAATENGSWSLVDPLGSRPDASVDAQGNIHVAWGHIPANRVATEFVYGFYPQGQLAGGRYHVVLQPEFRTTDRIEGPRIALTDDRVFIFWSTEIKTGLQAGEIVSSYVNFYQGQQRHFIAGQRIVVPASAGLDYQYEPDDSFVTGPRLAWTPEGYGTTQILQLTPNTSLTDQIALALRPRVSYRSQPQHSQIGVLYFDGADYDSYQLLTTTQAASINPNLVSGTDGYLYLSWLEKSPSGEDVVYLASTSPEMRTTFNEVSSDDVKTMLSETIFGLLSGMAFVPFVLIWLVPPMLLVALTSKLRRPEDGFTAPRTLISLAISLAGYWLIKLGMVPTMRSAVPLLVWIPVIPEGLHLILRIGIPVLIAVLALFVAYR